MKLIKRLRIRHLIDDTWVCEYNSGGRFKTDWWGVSAATVADSVLFRTYPPATNEYYNECRCNYENAVQTQLKYLASRGMGMND
jgi:hypothetical protein